MCTAKDIKCDDLANISLKKQNYRWASPNLSITGPQLYFSCTFNR